MQSVSSYFESGVNHLKRAYRSIESIINEPVVLNIVGYSQLIFSLFGLYSLTSDYAEYKKKKIRSLTWKQHLYILTPVFRDVSMIVTGLVSYPSRNFFQYNAKKILSVENYEAFYGDNVKKSKILFLIRLGSFILSLPASIKFSYRFYLWAKNKIFIKNDTKKTIILKTEKQDHQRTVEKIEKEDTKITIAPKPEKENKKILKSKRIDIMITVHTTIQLTTLSF